MMLIEVMHLHEIQQLNNSNGHYVAFLDDDDEWIDVDKIKKTNRSI